MNTLTSNCTGNWSMEEHSMSIVASRGDSWSARLRRALGEDRFVLHYQPIACLRTGSISHYEALVRLIDETDGSLVAPGLFLPAAEQHGLIGEIDRMVIRRVIEQLGEGPLGPGRSIEDVEGEKVRVAVNLSALSACDPEMLDYIQLELARGGVDPSRLIFEITETAAISDIEQAKTLCVGLAAIGCAAALDDFGAGFGSFYYVKHLPFRYLKIDGDFIRELAGSHRDQLLVRAIVQMAQGLGMLTIAEFVSDEATLRLLGELGVDYAQGYEIGRPQPQLGRLSAVA